MDGSLPAMDIHLPHSYHQGQSNEEIKQMLICTTMELQSVKAEERAHEVRLRHQEAQVRQLQDALFKARKERDEYREKCNQLQARLSRSPSLGSGLSDGITVNLSNVQQMESVSSMPEPTRATLSEVHRHMHEQQQQQFPHLEMQQHLHHQLDLSHHHMGELDLSQDNNHHMSSQQLEQLQLQLEMQQDDRAHEQLALDMHSPDRQSASAQCTDGRNPSSANSAPWSNFTTGVQMHGSDQSCSLMDESIRLQMEFSGSHLDQHSPTLDDFHGHLQHHQQEQQMQMQLQMQQRQESEMLLAHMQQEQRNSNPSHLHIADEQPCHSRLSEGQDVVGRNMTALQQSGWQRTTQSSSLMQNGMGSPSVTSMLTVPSFSMSSPPIPSGHQAPQLQNGSTQSSCLMQNGMGSPSVTSMVTVPSFSMSSPPIPNGHQAPQLLQNGSAVASILSPLERYGDSPCSTLMPPRPLHLPEPPEANAQVILSTLPEKGKLLEAVMQAGPLLKTLMVTGALPQWRHPPPAMDSLEIPSVSMSTMSMPCSEHSSSVSVMGRNGSNFSHVMRMSNSMHSTPPNGLCHAKAISSMTAGFDTYSYPALSSQRLLSQHPQNSQRLPLSNSHLSHDMILGPPLKYAKIH